MNLYVVLVGSPMWSPLSLYMSLLVFCLLWKKIF